MTTVLLVRHGESQANRHGVFAGQIDIDLEERGELQAEKTARFIKENYKVDRVYASDLIRAHRTGQAVADAVGLPLETDVALREIYAGEWENVPFKTLEENFAEDWHVWCTDLGRSRCTGGESVAELGERIMKAVKRLAEENGGKTIVIATHATPVRAMQCLVETGDITNMKEYAWVSNASVSEFFYEAGTWRIGRVSQDEHLSELVTGLPQGV
ncbi:MAG: histidine phosphatase family protein [Clostridia bacterium]|nr:histidine phosphatase family protein [Oscillospiraceae bacterium]MBQ7032252.1 histidine phosphatase family protein [Clostridia bacterium]